MIHVHINNQIDQNVLGYECGTRALFDTRRAGDPFWVFFDYDDIIYHIRTKNFLLAPTDFYIDSKGLLQKRISQPLSLS
jgi:hypothetical protein